MQVYIILASYFSSVFELFLGKNITIIFFYALLFSTLTRVSFNKHNAIIIFATMFWVILSNLLQSNFLRIADPYFLAGISNLVTLLVFLIIAFKKFDQNKLCFINPTFLNTLVLFSTCVAIAQEMEAFPLLTGDQKPHALTSGALVFGFVQSVSLLKLSKNGIDRFTILNLILALLTAPLHRSKFLFLIVILILIKIIFSLNIRRALFIVPFIFLPLLYYGLPIAFSIIQALEGSERVFRIMNILGETSIFGGNLAFLLGPLGRLGSGESYLLYFYASFGIIGLPVLFKFLKTCMGASAAFILVAGLTITEPLLSYVSILFISSFAFIQLKGRS